MRPIDWLKLVEFDIRGEQMAEKMLSEAETDLDTAHDRSYIYFHTQQAIEKSLKGLLEGKITVPTTNDIAVLLQLCSENGVNHLPDWSKTTLDIITSWESTFELQEDNEPVFRQAQELQAVLHDKLKEYVETSANSVERLVDKINHEYEAMCEGWRKMTADKLIQNAEHIATAKFIKVNAGDCMLDDAAEYLLQFKNPLEALMDSIAYRYDPMNIAEREIFSDMVDDLYDKHDLDSDFELEETDGMTMQ